MSDPERNSIEVSRAKLVAALSISAISFVAAAVAAAFSFSASPLFLLAPLPAAVVFVVIVTVLVRVPGHSIPEAAPAKLSPNAVPAATVTNDRTITVDDEREVYGIYATMQTLSASLSLSDTLRLVADRLQRLIPDATVVFALSGAEGEPVCNSGSFGPRAAYFPNRETVAEEQPAAIAINESGTATNVIPITQTKTGISLNLPAVAVPLICDGLAYGAITVVRDEAGTFTNAEVGLLESIALFAADGVHNALIQQRSHHTALTDPFMLLPNNRAAYTILDQRIAESLRHRNAEPVAVICLSLNCPTEQSGRDEELKSLCTAIGGQLRQMDILARGERNELLIILPRAARTEAVLVAERIRCAIDAQPGPVARLGEVELGIAAFPEDGETSSDILTEARNKTRSDTLTTVTGTFANVVTLDHWR